MDDVNLIIFYKRTSIEENDILQVHVEVNDIMGVQIEDKTSLM